MSKREIKQSGKPWITKAIKTKEPLKEEMHYFIQPSILAKLYQPSY